MTVLRAPRALYTIDVLEIARPWRHDLERLSYDTDLETQAALNALLDRRARLVSTHRVANLVTDAGRNFLLQTLIKGSGYTAAWYVGLKGTGTAVAGDTMASHAGWSELTGYTQSGRVAVQMSDAAAGSMSNSASRAVFTASTSLNVYGAFLTSNATKAGTAGVMLNVANFGAGAQARTAGQALRVQATLSAD